MKRYFLTACAIAIGSLGIAAPRASAADKTQEYQVPFAGFAASTCLLADGIVTNGTLTLATDGTSLETFTNGKVTYICNAETKASIAAPVQQTVVGGGPDTLSKGTSEVSTVVSNGVDVPIVDLANLQIAPGVNVVSVKMTASKADDSAIAAGLYSFNVPLTITCE